MASQHDEICDLNDIVLRESASADSELNRKSVRMPKRVLQCSDGVLEEFSTDDEETDAPKAVNTVKTLDWLPWAWYQTTWVSSKMLEGCDFVGESLASFFGITTPKYQFEIDEYHRLKALEEEKSRKTDLEMGGWNENRKNNLINHDQVSNSL